MNDTTSPPTLKSPRTTLRRKPDRGAHDFATIAAILDEGLFCHVGFVAGGQPYVIPTAYGREGDRLYIHGSAASRMQRSLAGGVPVCVTVTIPDALVLARSANHMSVDYRSVVVLGTAVLTEGEEKVSGLRAIVEHTVPGRWQDIRPPSEQELKAVSVLRLDIREASAKTRASGVMDDEEDYGLPVWAGVLPLALVPATPMPDPRLLPGIELPDYVASYSRPRTP
jgi:nitroimidazol reductase NimA-like FMN-containing flavoprotein (pyridoxamine 5'-phosphate oxidase superfamily)